MSFREQITYAGNVNRIMEAHEGGMGRNAIVGMFRDFGIPIKPSHVDAIIESRQPLASRALPKSVVRRHVRAVAASASFAGATPLPA